MEGDPIYIYRRITRELNSDRGPASPRFYLHHRAERFASGDALQPVSNFAVATEGALQNVPLFQKSLKLAGIICPN
jgi:hypothetical protein